METKLAVPALAEMTVELHSAIGRLGTLRKAEEKAGELREKRFRELQHLARRQTERLRDAAASTGIAPRELCERVNEIQADDAAAQREGHQ